MLSGSDRSGESSGKAWQEVTIPFVSHIAIEAQRLAHHIQGQLARYIHIRNAIYQPIWRPDHSVLTSPRWAQRLISQFHRFPYPVLSTRNNAPLLTADPTSSFRFWQDHGLNRHWLPAPGEVQMVTTDGVLHESAPFVPYTMGLHQDNLSTGDIYRHLLPATGRECRFHSP